MRCSRAREKEEEEEGEMSLLRLPFHGLSVLSVFGRARGFVRLDCSEHIKREEQSLTQSPSKDALVSLMLSAAAGRIRTGPLTLPRNRRGYRAVSITGSLLPITVTLYHRDCLPLLILYALCYKCGATF